MTVDEFRNALRMLLNDAIRGGLSPDDLSEAAEAELHPSLDADDIILIAGNGT